MQIENFKIFCDLVETASFSKTAELNSITQSAVSQQIRALERKFEVALIERGKKNFSVTSEGRAFLQASKEILKAYDGLGEKLQQLQHTVAGTLKIATVFSIGLHELPRNLKLFQREYPAVEVTVEYLRASQVYQQVSDGSVDLGLVAFPGRRRGVAVESYWKDKLVLICPPNHPLASRRSAPIGALEGQPFISFAFDQPTRKAIDRIFRINHVAIRRTMEFDNIETVKRAVEIEHGISIVPLTTIEKEHKLGTLIPIEIESANMWRPIGILQKRNKVRSSAARAFVMMLKKRTVL